IRCVVEAGFKTKNIIFSGYNEFEYAKLAVKLGVVDYILKPVDPKEFLTAMKRVIDELDKKREDMANEKKINGFINEYALYAMVNGRKPEGISDLSFCDEYHAILLVEFTHDFFGKEVVDFDKEVLLDILRTKAESQAFDDCIYLNLNQQQGIIFLKGKDKLFRLDDSIEFAVKLHEVILKKYGHKCYVAVSDYVESHEQIPDTMDYLDELMENRFYHSDVYVFSSKKSKETPELVQIDDDTLMKQIKQDMKMKDISGLREHFKRLSNKYHSQSYFSHIYVKFIFSNLLKEFYNNIPNASEEQFNKEIEKLYTCDDIDTIVGIIAGHIDELEKRFNQNPQMAHREIETVKQYIFDHYGEEIGVDFLADMVYLTPSYLSAIFKKETGQNLSKFIKQYRMEQAKDMLENTNKKIVNISIETGYPNVSYFCQSFREYFGISPQKFRERGGSDE
ncbi:MAG: helix-turn-helix domain-containing protein, partial [Eubacteriales bacterium]|nr:helix-turn-helix domain-containing protein [Eubacteriales bacterium]